MRILSAVSPAIQLKVKACIHISFDNQEQLDCTCLCLWLMERGLPCLIETNIWFLLSHNHTFGERLGTGHASHDDFIVLQLGTGSMHVQFVQWKPKWNWLMAEDLQQWNYTAVKHQDFNFPLKKAAHIQTVLTHTFGPSMTEFPATLRKNKRILQIWKWMRGRVKGMKEYVLLWRTEQILLFIFPQSMRSVCTREPENLQSRAQSMWYKCSDVLQMLW